MAMKTTSRGFSVMEFMDAEGAACSIQDSSIADQACIWLGPDGADRQVRMHLTQDMARSLLERLLHDASAYMDFLDLYGSRCVVRPSEDASPNLVVGIVLDFEGRPQRPMRLSAKEIALLAPVLSTFVETGSIAG